MTDEALITQMETIYNKLLSSGDFTKAQEVLLKIADLKIRNESVPSSKQSILLG